MTKKLDLNKLAIAVGGVVVADATDYDTYLRELKFRKYPNREMYVKEYYRRGTGAIVVSVETEGYSDGKCSVSVDVGGQMLVAEHRKVKLTDVKELDSAMKELVLSLNSISNML